MSWSLDMARMESILGAGTTSRRHPLSSAAASSSRNNAFLGASLGHFPSLSGSAQFSSEGAKDDKRFYGVRASAGETSGRHVIITGANSANSVAEGPTPFLQTAPRSEGPVVEWCWKMRVRGVRPITSQPWSFLKFVCSQAISEQSFKTSWEGRNNVDAIEMIWTKIGYRQGDSVGPRKERHGRHFRSVEYSDFGSSILALEKFFQIVRGLANCIRVLRNLVPSAFFLLKIPFFSATFTLLFYSKLEIGKVACRNEESGKAAAREIAQGSKNPNVRSMALDLGSLKSVRQFASEYKETDLPLHVLVNNAGIMACPQAYTEDNFERQLGVNHLGHFLLTSLLLDNLVASASAEQKSRVVVLASAAERIGEIDFRDLNYKGSRVYNNWGAYGQSKLANCLFSLELANRSQKLGLPVISNSMHPGIVNTNLTRYVLPSVTIRSENPSPIERVANSFFGLFGLKTPEQGASTSIYLATSPEVENSSGLYYGNSKEATPSLNARNSTVASQLWDESVELTGASSALKPLGLAMAKATGA